MGLPTDLRHGIVTIVLAVGLLASPAARAATPGTADASYGNDPPYGIVQGPNGTGYDPGGVTALSDGSLLVADGSDIGLTKLSSGGAPAPDFGANGTASVPAQQVDNSSANAVAVTPDGSDYLVAGSVGGNTDMAVARFTSDGSLDTSFSTGGADPGVYRYNNTPAQGTQATSSTGQDLAVASDGTIWEVGTAEIGSPSEPELVLDRIASDCSGDMRFTMQLGGQPTTGVAVAVGPNGTAYVSGVENPGTASARAILAQVQRSGLPASLRLDASFNPSGTTPGVLATALGATSAQLDALAVAPNGDLLIAGEVTGSTETGVVARVTPAGALDPTFGSGGVVDLTTIAPQPPMSEVTAMALEPNGAPVIAGNSEHTNPGSGATSPPTVSFVAQLTTAGALEPTFAPGARPGVLYQSAQSASTSGYDNAQLTGLAIAPDGGIQTALAAFSTGSALADEGTIERVVGFAKPIASFAAPAAVVAGQPATFDASASSDPAGSITDYAWDFDGSQTYATDGGATPTIQHTFTTPGTVSVSLRVSNAAGQTSDESVPVTVLAATHQTATLPGSPTPHVSLSATSLSFHANINDFDAVETDTPPQIVDVTNTGTAPLTIDQAEVINSLGGFAISDLCISTLGSDGTYSGNCTPIKTPADTCSHTTLAPGARCTVSVQYQDGGQYPAATGALAIVSNATSSPDLVTLNATATILPNTGGISATRCPGTITSGALSLAACWTDVTNSYYPSTVDTWASFGQVTINNQLTLVPTATDDEMFAANGTISATPAGAKYVVEVSNSSAAPSIPIGTVSLGTTPLVCTPGDDKGCGTLLPIQGAGYLYHGLPITGADAVFGGGNVLEGGGTACLAANTEVYALLPRLFGTAPNPASARPTVTLQFGGCTQSQGPGGGGGGAGGGGGGGTNGLTCPGEKVPTPNCSGHTVIRDQPSARRARAVRSPRDDGDGSSQCPDGDEDYTDAVPAAFVGGMQFGDPYLCYDPARQVWTAGGTISVLGATVDSGPPPDYGISFDSHGNFLNGAIKDITTAIPIAPGVLLTDFGGGFGLHPTRLGLHATVQAGGIVTITGGGFAVWADPHDPSPTTLIAPIRSRGSTISRLTPPPSRSRTSPPAPAARSASRSPPSAL